MRYPKFRGALGFAACLTLSVASVSLPGSEGERSPDSSTASQVRTIGWADLASPRYREYLDRLRAAGCPEDKIRWIARTDADEWLLQQRIAYAVTNDFSWWKDDPPPSTGDSFRTRYEELRRQRQALLLQALGPDTPMEPDPSTEMVIAVDLPGPVLGALPREKYNAVQEVCARSLDRHQGYFSARQNQGVFLNQGDMARMRDQTRADLAEILTPEELQEFLIRFSHNATRLRRELAGMEPTPEEFRKVFAAIDALEHRLQLEYGAIDSLSARQRERFQREREEAIKSVLPEDRYQRYLVGRYPLFRQAQSEVRRAGLPEDTILPFFELLNEHESRRREVLNNTAMTVAQRQAGLQALEREKEEALQRLLGDAGYRQYRESRVN